MKRNNAVRLVHDHTCDVDSAEYEYPKHDEPTKWHWWTLDGETPYVYRDKIGRLNPFGGTTRWLRWRCAWEEDCKGELLVREDWIRQQATNIAYGEDD